MKYNRKLLTFTGLFVLLIAATAYNPPDEGLFPLSEIQKIDLTKAGLKISQKEIYTPDSISLIDALVNVGGCTGSFVSEEGLIITNHHCAFSAVQQASTAENDYLDKGFVASTREQEIEAKGLTCRITDSYTDVSAQVLSAAAGITDPAEKISAINSRIKSLVAEAEAADKSVKAEVSEMFIGKTYVLFRYKTIRDVRLVYVPSRNIGEFGGETDNWVWPRHTGDFSFVRAYVAPDGSPAAYSRDNVPYKPRKFLKVNTKGVNEEDFVFILGYPGKTFRNRPWQYLQYQQDYLLPYIAKLFEFQNEAMEEAGRKDKATELKLASRIKRNANVLKNYRGKLKGLKALNLIAEKRQEDEALNAYIQENDQLKLQHGTLMKDIDKFYNEIYSDAYRDLWLSQIYTSTSLLNIAGQINGFKAAMMAKPLAERNTFFSANLQELKNRLKGMYDSYDAYADRVILTKMLTEASQLPKNQRISAVDRQISKGFNSREQIDKFVSSVLGYSRLKDEDFVFSTLLRTLSSFTNYNDPLLMFEKELTQQKATLKTEKDRREGVLNQLMASYIELKEKFKSQNFLPDANGTLRLSYGYVRGYSPADATYMKAFTSVKGIIEKGRTGLSDFEYPPAIEKLWQARDFGPFMKQDLNDVPVAFLYNLDTTGGNSGSPVLNAFGELVGLNFDRVYEATVNDFAWNESYSRSIGVDIRYVLWVASKVDKADFLLKEIGMKM